MSSKKAMKLAQKQAFAKHRSNITANKFNNKKINFPNKAQKKIKNLNFPFQISQLYCMWTFLKFQPHY